MPLKLIDLDREDANIQIPQLVTEVKSGRPGRPRKEIDINFLRSAITTGHSLKVTELAETLHVSRRHLYAVMKKHGINRLYSQISDAELDDLLRQYKADRPESGIRYGISFLRRRNLRVQRDRVAKALKRVDRVGTAMRERRHIQRRKYRRKRPNNMWHIDGHHKLIRWGIVIHGLIDGYCRSVRIPSVFNSVQS